uniref:hypothetical protein n=1 Tax=Cupriavidus necator TaxID=106590 RepID=UPI003F499AA4
MIGKFYRLNLSGRTAPGRLLVILDMPFVGPKDESQQCVLSLHAMRRLRVRRDAAWQRLLWRGPDSLGIGDACSRQNRACRTIRDIPGIGMLIRVEAHLRHRVTINRAIRQRDTPIQSTLRVNPAKD